MRDIGTKDFEKCALESSEFPTSTFEEETEGVISGSSLKCGVARLESPSFPHFLSFRALPFESSTLGGHSVFTVECPCETARRMNDGRV